MITDYHIDRTSLKCISFPVYSNVIVSSIVSDSCMSAHFSVVICCRYVEILCSLMSDNCRYLVETFEYDKEVYGGINPCYFVIKNLSLSLYQ